MRYAQGCGLTAAQRTKREQVRLRAAELFARGHGDIEVARQLRVTRMPANRRHRAWAQRGSTALASKGPTSLPRLSQEQFTRLRDALLRGPAARGWADRHWTLARVKTVIGRMFHIFQRYGS